MFQRRLLRRHRPIVDPDATADQLELVRNGWLPWNRRWRSRAGPIVTAAQRAEMERRINTEMCQLAANEVVRRRMMRDEAEAAAEAEVQEEAL